MADREKLSESWFKSEILSSLGEVQIEWVDPSTNDNQPGIVAVQFRSQSGLVLLD